MPQDPRWRQEGVEPDYRFSLANERTFLAWIRTALALLAGGVLLEQFATSIQPRGVVIGLAISLALLSACLSGMAYLRWKSNEIAMRHSRPLPRTWAIPFVVAVMVAVATTLAVVLLP